MIRFLAAALVFIGCRGDGAATDARIGTTPSGAVITFRGKTARLPAGDVKGDAPVRADDTMRRLAYPTVAGTDRVVYAIGDGLFVGPLVAHPADFRAVPGIDHALGPLFEAAGPRRLELVREVHRERGDEGVFRLLVDAAYVDDPAWDEARKQLPPKQEKWLRDALASGLEPGKSPLQLRRAVALVDLADPDLAKLVVKRTKALVAEEKEPRAVAALLRAVLANDKETAAALGCEVLAKKGGDRDALLEAATLAIAAAGKPCSDPALLETLLADACLPYFRCNDAGPIGWGDTSNQDEPLCTKAELDRAVAAELQRPPRAALEGTPRPALFALAALGGKVPPAFVAAHARRRYALAQPAEPACSPTLDAGTPCHCEEANLRLFACRNASAVGMCRFEIDDKQKKIQNVVSATGPTH